MQEFSTQSRSQKERLDRLLVLKGLCDTVEEAGRLIMAGQVWSEQVRLEKAGMLIAIDKPLRVEKSGGRFVSRAGEKLAFALEQFGVEVKGKTVIDIGTSTGGFVDCLLQNGAKEVLTVDVGYGQIDIKLRNDLRVRLFERTNARYLKREQLGEGISLATIDVSFISALKIIEPVSQEFHSIQDWIILYKPQFELERSQIGKGGKVRNPTEVEENMGLFIQRMQGWRFHCSQDPKPAPITGLKSGNQEYLMHFKRA